MVNKAFTIASMKRALVLTNEAARHRFRASLPLTAFGDFTARPPRSDLAFFGVSFISSFIIIFGLIA